MEDVPNPKVDFVGTIGGMMISIPRSGAISPIHSVKQQGSIDCTLSGDTAGTASLEDSEVELLQQVEATIGKRLSAAFERDARNDSFLNRLSALSQSRINATNEGNNATNEGNNAMNEVSYEKLFIGDIADDLDVVSRASGMDSEAATHRELIEGVERLDEFLKQTELKLTHEKKKRREREKNLIKLAKELGTRGEIIESQQETMSEVSSSLFVEFPATKFLTFSIIRISQLRDELRSARVDISLLKTRLKNESVLNKATKVESKKDYMRSIDEAQAVYDHTCSEHDLRICDISKTHAKQCEDLCREVIGANQEAARLRRSLKELNCHDASKKSKGNLVPKMITAVVAAATACVVLSASGESPVGMCSGSAGAPKLDMINHQLFVPRPTILKPTIDARQSVEAAAPRSSSLPIEPREIKIHEPEEVSIEAKIDDTDAFVRSSKLSTEIWIRTRGQAVVQMFSLLNGYPNLLKGLSMTPDLPENALLTLILKSNCTLGSHRGT